MRARLRDVTRFEVRQRGRFVVRKQESAHRHEVRPREDGEGARQGGAGEKGEGGGIRHRWEGGQSGQEA
jgi:hypothetical protein